MSLQHSIFFLLAACCCLMPITNTEASTEYNRYLAHIFQKYGNGGTMSFEGLEHLMYSLGLGQIEFEPAHTIEDHRPKGFQPDSEQNLKRYIEKQVHKLSTNEDDDVQISHGVLERNNAEAAMQQQRKINTDEVETVTRDRVIKEKGILLEFKEMHDPKHRHPRENDATFDGPPLSANDCLSPKSLLHLVVDHDDLHKRKLYKTVALPINADDSGHGMPEEEEQEYNDFINHVKLTPVAFMKLCPALLAQIDQHVCAHPAPLTHGEDPKQLLWNAWIYASGSIFVLSACGLLGILIVPLMKSVAYQEILKFLVAVAVGTLSGDALMHLLPHALIVDSHGEESSHAPADTHGKHSHDNTPVWVCGCAFATAVFMYILESLLPLLKGSDNAHGHSHSAHGHSHAVHGHSHSHSQPHAAPTSTPPTASVEAPMDDNVMLNELQKDKKAPSRPLTPVAFMVIIGDGLHNLTDGLAIGAAFAADPVTGMATAFAVLCHELPHELGDFALLLQTGVSLKRAVFLNIISSVLSFVGMAVGLLIAGVHSNMTQWIYAGTAGSFLYIAFADLIPAMSEGGKRDFKSSVIQIMGMLVGGVIMLLIAVNEDDLQVLFK